MEATNTLCLQGIAHLLVGENLLCHEQAKQYQQLAANTELSFVHYLVRHHVISAKTLALCLAQHFNIAFIDLDCIDKNALPLSLIDKTLCIQHRLLPLRIHEKQLIVATDDPSQQAALKEIQFHTTLFVTPCVVEADKLNICIEKLTHQHEHQALTDYFLAPSHANDDALMVKFINRMIHEAIEKNASDIHFEPYEETYRIRYRQDGLLSEVASPPISLATRIAARLKIMSNLDIAERRLPQDGRFTLNTSNSKTIDCRVSTCPVVAGEKIVVRLLNADMTKQPIETLPLTANQRKLLLDALSKPQGMLLVTGPTGSGKTSTLYAALTFLNHLERNISTAEDPVEIHLPGINQVHINPKIGLTFATALRACLRQDPDVIMIGEIRDLETADIAIKAAQTGHLVLSTLHTNSAAQTITRLINMGVQPFNIAGAVRLIVAQRLIRRLCNHCKFIRDDLTDHELIEFGLKQEDVLFKANGCHHCHLGYHQRIAIFEMMPLSPALNQIILARQSASNILKQAQLEGMLTLYQSGLEHVKAGASSIEELRRVIVE